MAKFKYCITETLSRVVEVEAENSEEAYHTVKAMYRNEEIVLNADDFLCVDCDWVEWDGDKRQNDNGEWE